MFKNSGYTYKIVNNQIIVSKANAVAAVEKQQQQQAKKVTGCVKDALGEPIIGASVVEKGLRPMVRLPISMVTLH